jgi:serine/threonine protein phosphatase PrpC
LVRIGAPCANVVKTIITWTLPVQISVGQHSDKGRKNVNQDFCGLRIPDEPQRSTKGIVVALADGISSSSVSQIASQSAVTGFIEDYYCTSDAWSVKTSAERVLEATNAWLAGQTRQSPYRFHKDQGYVCTFSALVLKSNTAHLLHVGDSRIYRLGGQSLEQLTRDHRVWLSAEQSYLSRALGADVQLEVDYLALPIEVGDVFVLATDGVFEFAEPQFLVNALLSGLAQPQGLDAAAQRIVAHALERGSTDNLTVQIVRVDVLSAPTLDEIAQRLPALVLPPLLSARSEFDGFTIVREIHGSSRSHVYLAIDKTSQAMVALKTPSVDMHLDAAHMERFLLEEWVARRLNSPHVLKAMPPERTRHFAYVVNEFVEGQTLTQWMIDHPKPSLDSVRALVVQISKGLQAFHRLEMVHQDLRPDNILIDRTGTAKIIDFGSTRVAGIAEAAPLGTGEHILGTPQYTAPEYFLGDIGSARSDLFSLGVLTYQMLTGQLPYGAEVAKARTVLAQRNLRYNSALADDREIPRWIDDVLRKAVNPNPNKRYQELSEFVYDLHQPNAAFISSRRAPLLERNPLLFWQCLCLCLAAACIALIAWHTAGRL